MKNHLSLRLLCLLSAILVNNYGLVAQSNPVSKENYVREMDKKIHAWLDEFVVPGAAFALIENGEVILQKGYGYADVKKKTMVNAQTGFNIGSISKTVAAWGVMKLVEEGKIDLDSPAEKYLTRWHLPKTKYDNSKVTIRRLLSHTAGLSLHGYPGWSPSDKLPTIEESLSGKNNGPGDVRLIMEPGTKWKYSGGGFTILQLIIEEVSGKKFADYMQSEILNPMGMKNSSFTIDSRIMASSSLEHDSFGEVIPFELFTAEAAAGLHTTIEDFVTFALASLDISNGKKTKQSILKSATLELMTSPAKVSNGSYGLGYQVDPIKNTSEVYVGHGGSNTGWHAILRVNRKTKDGFIMVTNGGSGHNVYRQAYCDWINWKLGVSLGNRCRKQLVPTLIRVFKSDGIEATIAKYKDAKKSEADVYSFNPNILNSFGYGLLGKNKLKEAIAIFKLNVEEYPEHWNGYDSLGEAYMNFGNKVKAIANYKKSVELNPENQGGIDKLKELGVDTKSPSAPFVVGDKVLESYVGRYELRPGFVITISKNGNQLKAKATGQPEALIFPKSENVFYLKVMTAQLTFNKNSDGEVESVTLLQGGQTIVGKKLKK